MLIYGKDVPEMSAIEFGNELRENPNALVHFQAWTWDWWIIGANSKGENPIVFALILHDREKHFAQFPFKMIEDGLDGKIDLDFKETPIYDIYLGCPELPDLYSQENEENPIAYAHFKKEARDGRYWHWFITEGRKESDGDYRLFGLVNGFDKEIGYVMLSELASVGAVHDLKFGKIGIYDIYEDFDLRR